MTDTFLEVTAGSGVKLHTHSKSVSGSTVHDEVIVHGEPQLAAYVVANTSAISFATANSHLLQVMAGASLKVRLRRLRVYQMGMATTATVGQIGLYRLSTAGTGGTSYTPQLMDPGDAAAGATGMTLPTGKGTEGAVLWMGSVYLMQTVGASAQLNEPIIDLDWDKLRLKAPVISAGTANGLALKNVTGIAGATVFVVADIEEASY